MIEVRVGRGAARGALLILALLLAAPAGAAVAADDVFTVAAVRVDATAANANAARDAARAEGERHAYGMLMERLTLAADHGRIPPPTDRLLNGLIAGFEVANERSSSVRYLADYTYHFRPDAVRALLRDAGIPFAETPSRPLVVLATFEGPSGPVLWEDPNPWRDAWAARTPPQGLVPLILPLGDLEDIAAIDAAAASSADEARLKAISTRYKGADVLVAHASLKADVDPHVVDIAATRLSPASGLAPQTWTNGYTASPGESDADLFADAVAGTAAQIEDAWKQANLIDFGKTGTIVVRVPTGDLNSWIEVLDRLADTPSVRHSDLLSIDQTEARLSLRYFGDTAQLRTALAQRGLQLEGDDPDWVLERRSAAPAH